MKLLQAIAESSGNKARAISDSGAVIVVQERYSGITDRWWHIWRITSKDVTEADIPYMHLERVEAYDVDPDGTYWSVVK